MMLLRMLQFILLHHDLWSVLVASPRNVRSYTEIGGLESQEEDTPKRILFQLIYLFLTRYSLLVIPPRTLVSTIFVSTSQFSLSSVLVSFLWKEFSSDYLHDNLTQALKHFFLFSKEILFTLRVLGWSETKIKFIGWVDSDFGSDTDTRKSMAGYVSE
jgi:hypothetical protein